MSTYLQISLFSYHFIASLFTLFTFAFALRKSRDVIHDVACKWSYGATIKTNGVTNAAFHSCRDLVFTRPRDPGNHQFTTCQWNALLSDVTTPRHRGINSF